ncbi:MAG: hypothetical protein GY803_10345, partial [Chloroflexi bacterium]|nr:hypothetical protein [Chloroflexota bacterium]
MTMTPKWKILISAIFLVVTILFFAPLNNAVAQTTQTMLLTNGDFEQGLSDWATFGASPSGHEGRSGAGAYWRANGFAGIYQQAAVTPGTTVRLSAWTKGWSGNDENSLSDEAWMRQRIGIDPTGGTDPNSPNIAWSLPAQLTQWGQLAVEVAATSEQVT